MSRKPLKITFEGFEDLIEEIEKAGGKVETAAIKAVNEGVDIVYNELHAQCAKTNVPASITQEIKKTPAQMKDGICSGAVGWDLGPYNPANPSAGYKAIFLNYGTPRRKTRAGENRGQILRAKRFIGMTKTQSRKKVKAAQEAALNEILKGLKK